MTRFTVKALEKALSSNSHLLLQDYRDFQNCESIPCIAASRYLQTDSHPSLPVLRDHKHCPLSAETAEEHLRLVQHRYIDDTTEQGYVREVLKFHHWVCKQDKKHCHELEIADVLCLYDQFYKYCQFKIKDHKMESWTLNKTCQGVLSWVKFIRTHEQNPSSQKDLDDMLEKVRGLHAALWRKMNASLKDRPSLCELREQGKALSFLDFIKVHEAQHLRVAIFLKRLRKGGRKGRKAGALLQQEVKRLAVLSTLLRCPTRKNETRECVITVVSANSWRLKLPAGSRKSGKYPLDVKLSP